MEYTVDFNTKDDIDFSPKTELQEILQNVKMILSTPKFSVPLDREFGIEGSIIDKPINEGIQATIRSAIFTALKIYEPRVELVSVKFKADSDMLRPIIVIRFKEGLE